MLGHHISGMFWEVAYRAAQFGIGGDKVKTNLDFSDKNWEFCQLKPDLKNESRFAVLVCRATQFAQNCAIIY